MVDGHLRDKGGKRKSTGEGWESMIKQNSKTPGGRENRTGHSGNV